MDLIDEEAEEEEAEEERPALEVVNQMVERAGCSVIPPRPSFTAMVRDSSEGPLRSLVEVLAAVTDGNEVVAVTGEAAVVVVVV